MLERKIEQDLNRLYNAKDKQALLGRGYRRRAVTVLFFVAAELRMIAAIAPPGDCPACTKNT